MVGYYLGRKTVSRRSEIFCASVFRTIRIKSPLEISWSWICKEWEILLLTRQFRAGRRYSETLIWVTMGSTNSFKLINATNFVTSLS